MGRWWSGVAGWSVAAVVPPTIVLQSSNTSSSGTSHSTSLPSGATGDQMVAVVTSTAGPVTATGWTASTWYPPQTDSLSGAVLTTLERTRQPGDATLTITKPSGAADCFVIINSNYPLLDPGGSGMLSGSPGSASNWSETTTMVKDQSAALVARTLNAADTGTHDFIGPFGPGDFGHPVGAGSLAVWWNTTDPDGSTLDIDISGTTDTGNADYQVLKFNFG